MELGSLSTAINDSVSTINDHICHNFAASEGGVIWITTAGANLLWSLFGPNEELVDEWASPTRRVDVLMESAGEYKLAVRKNSGSTGAYNLGLSDQPVETLPGLAYDTPITDTLCPSGDVDERPFIGTAGETVTTNADTTTTSDVMLRLLDYSTRAILAQGSNGTWSDADDSEIFDHELPATGNYIVQVFTEVASESGTPSYTLTAQ
ncbi:MAG: hypothetical protein ACI835_001379 [Planctomycetota bacterium]|jgi:hypothetical protein